MDGGRVGFCVTVPHAFPALENGSSEQTMLMSAGYTFLFNLVSFSLLPGMKKKES